MAGKNGQTMRTCETCGNEYDKTFVVEIGGERHIYDSFECAVHALAPTCKHCGVRVIGHGVEAKDRVFCCASCAQQEGVRGVVDRAEAR
jgi:hypothetical protein